MSSSSGIKQSPTPESSRRRSLSDFFKKPKKSDHKLVSVDKDAHEGTDINRAHPHNFWGRMKQRLTVTLHHDKRPKMTAKRRQRIMFLLWIYVKLEASRRNAEVKTAAKYAAYCVQDAFDGHLSNGLASNSKKSATMLAIFRFQTSPVIYCLIMFMSCAHSVAVFYEGTSYLPGVLGLVLTIVALLIYSIDVGLKMSYEGVKEYFNHDWQKVYVVVILSMCIEVALTGRVYYTNMLRPSAGVLRSRSGRRFFNIIHKMLSKLSQSFIPMIFVIMMVVVINNIVLGGVHEPFNNTSLSSYNWIWLAFTNDTYDILMPDSLNLNIAYVVCFFIAIYVIQKFFLSLVLGATFDIFNELIAKQLRDERIKTMKGLVKAFSELDIDCMGFILANQFYECMLALRPGISVEEISLYYELISGGDDRISVIQFLSLGDVLSVDFVRCPSSKTADIMMNRIETSFKGGNKTHKNMLSPAVAMHTSLYDESAETSTQNKVSNKHGNVISRLFTSSFGLLSALFSMHFITTMDVFFVMTDFHGTSIPYIVSQLCGLGISGITADNNSVKEASSYMYVCSLAVENGDLYLSRVLTPGFIISMIYLLDGVLRFVGLKSPDESERKYGLLSRLSFSAAVFMGVNNILEDMTFFNLYPSALVEFGNSVAAAIVPFELGGFSIGLGLAYWVNIIYTFIASNMSSLLLIARSGRCCRMMVLNKDLQDLWVSCISVAPAFFEVMMFAFTFTYMFSMVGFLLFGAQSEEWSTPIHAFVTGLQLCLPQDFVSIMEKTMALNHWTGSLYFYVFFILGMVITNLSLSLIMEWYGTSHSSIAEEDRAQAAISMQQSFRVVLERAIRRMVLEKSFNLCRLSTRRSSRFFPSHFSGMTAVPSKSGHCSKKSMYGGGEDTLNADDLKQCQKYSNVDLESHYETHLKSKKNVHKHAEFLAALRRQGRSRVIRLLEGELLYNAGDEAIAGYFIVDGCIELSNSSGVSVNVPCSNLIGIEVLQPECKYSLTARAVLGEGQERMTAAGSVYGTKGAPTGSTPMKSKSPAVNAGNGSLTPVAVVVLVSQEMLAVGFDEQTTGMLVQLAFHTRYAIHQSIHAQTERIAKRRREELKKLARNLSTMGLSTKSNTSTGNIDHPDVGIGANTGSQPSNPTPSTVAENLDCDDNSDVEGLPQPQ